eukprot:1593930-Rhodomonas_salina.1
MRAHHTTRARASGRKFKDRREQACKEESENRDTELTYASGARGVVIREVIADVNIPAVGLVLFAQQPLSAPGIAQCRQITIHLVVVGLPIIVRVEDHLAPEQKERGE